MNLIAETKIAERLGLTRNALTALRRKHLTKRIDYRREKAVGGRIMWTEDGLKKMCEELGVAVPLILSDSQEEKGAEGLEARSGPTESEATGSIPAVPVGIVLRVEVIPINPSFVMARNPETNAIYQVRVGNNSLYAVGDKLRAIPDPSTPAIYLQIGPKPRHAGDHHYAVTFK